MDFDESIADIQSKEDIVLLVDTFYEKVMKQGDLSPFFAELDFAHHKTRMIHFWSFVLLDEAGYTTNVFDKHVHMALEDKHFDTWLTIFETTVMELFAGEKAETAIFRAKTIGWSFKEKFKHLRKNEKP